MGVEEDMEKGRQIFCPSLCPALLETSVFACVLARQTTKNFLIF
jgi:hypothetical protein